jgi:hypothetical protein
VFLSSDRALGRRVWRTDIGSRELKGRKATAGVEKQGKIEEEKYKIKTGQLFSAATTYILAI